MAAANAESTPAPANATLVVVQGRQFGERFPLPPAERITVGSGSDCDVRLEGRGVAATHCAILRDPEHGFVVRHVDGEDGTLVNGRRITELPLGDGDHVACGDVEFRFEGRTGRTVQRTALEIDPSKTTGEFTQQDDRSARALVVGGARALGGLAFVAAMPCAGASTAERACQGVLDACRSALGARRGAVLRMEMDGEVDVIAVRRASSDPRRWQLDLPQEWLDRVTADERALQLLRGDTTAVLVPVPCDAKGVALYLEIGDASGIGDPLAAAAAIGTLLGATLDRIERAVSGGEYVARMQLLIDSSDDMLFALDDEGRIAFCNHAPGRRGSAGAEALMGTRLIDLVGLADRTDLLGLLDAALEDGTEGVLETELQLPEGGHQPVRVELAPLRNANGVAVGVRGVARDLREVEAMRAAAGTSAGAVQTLTGSSAAMQAVREAVQKAQQHRYPVLVAGETGTGKELVARAIHAGSEDRAARFAAVNCAALPETLLEAELFGQGRGGQGLLASADGGVLFLDEIGEMPPATQARLLRALEGREDRTDGRDGAPTGDVRLIVATHRDLQAMVKAGTFRGDLLYRLDVMRVELPPLRERMEDLPELVRAGLERVRAETGLNVSIDDDAVNALAAYHWPGNVRELLNVVRRAAVSATGDRIRRSDVDTRVRGLSPADAPEPDDGTRSIRDIERDAINRAIEAAGGNRKLAAAMLGMPRATFYRRLKRYNIT